MRAPRSRPLVLAAGAARLLRSLLGSACFFVLLSGAPVLAEKTAESSEQTTAAAASESLFVSTRRGGVRLLSRRLVLPPRAPFERGLAERLAERHARPPSARSSAPPVVPLHLPLLC